MSYQFSSPFRVDCEIPDWDWVTKPDPKDRKQKNILPIEHNLNR